jgi:DNA-binding CsgD family transcriptional regulator
MGKIGQVRSILEDPFDDWDRLTDQEKNVLRLASRGFTNRYISSNQGISEEMVAYTLRNGLLKLDVKKKDLPNLVFARIERIVNR